MDNTNSIRDAGTRVITNINNSANSGGKITD